MHQSELPNEATLFYYSWLIKTGEIDLEEIVTVTVAQFKTQVTEKIEIWPGFLELWEECTKMRTDLTVDAPPPPTPPMRTADPLDAFYPRLGTVIGLSVLADETVKLASQCSLEGGQSPPEGGRSFFDSLLEDFENDDFHTDYTWIAKCLMSEQFPETLVELQRFTLADRTA